MRRLALSILLLSIASLAYADYGGPPGPTPAGTNLIGKVGIDQTTPGTTNGVQVNAALPAGANSIGSVLLGIAASDGSTTITIGGTAQSLFAGATPTNGWWVVNPDSTEDCWVSDSTTAAANNTGSMRLALNGGSIMTPPGYKPFAAVSVVCATTGHKLTARKW